MQNFKRFVDTLGISIVLNINHIESIEVIIEDNQVIYYVRTTKHSYALQENDDLKEICQIP